MKLPKTLRLPVSAAASVLLLAALILALRMEDAGLEQPATVATVRVGTPVESKVKAAPVFPEKAMLRPLPVSLKLGNHEWAAGDCSDPQVIEKIAHSPEEFIRMTEENDRIKRRQLVYRKETVAAVIQRARGTGETIRSLTLPGMDGREISVEVVRADLALSGLSGTFTGRVSGKEQSIVTVAFKNNREAFSVSSPEDDLFLEAEPREPGEVIIKEIDPATYVTGKCGNPEHE